MRGEQIIMIPKYVVAVLLMSTIMLALIPVSSLSFAESMEDYFDVKILINARYVGGSIISIDIKFEFINKFMEPVRIFVLKEPQITLIYSNTTKMLSVPCKSRILDADVRSSTTYAMARLYLLVSDVPGRLIINGGLIEVVYGNRSLANLTKIISYNMHTASSKILFSSISLNNSGNNKVVRPQMNYREKLYKLGSLKQQSQSTIAASPQINVYKAIRIKPGENISGYNTNLQYSYTYMLEIIGITFLLLTVLVLYLLKSRFVQ